MPQMPAKVNIATVREAEERAEDRPAASKVGPVVGHRFFLPLSSTYVC